MSNVPSGVSTSGFFGHPRGLMTLFFTEMWERFSYYGMRAILTLFMTTATINGGLGFSDRMAGPIYAMYTSMVYLVTVPGGWLADNFLGQRKAILYGGIVIMIGHILLAMHGLPFFYSGLGCVVIGTGLLKPNISAVVGQIYTPEDTRRDAGFSIFYMGINLGAFTSPLVCGWLAQGEGFKSLLEGWGLDPVNSWHWGFGAAAVGMFFGLMQYVLTGRHLGDAGLKPAEPKNDQVRQNNKRTLTIGLAGLAVVIVVVAYLGMQTEYLTQSNIKNGFTVMLLLVVVGFFSKLFLTGDWTKAERARLYLIFVLFCAAAIFWGIFEQAGSTLTLFADRSTNNVILGNEFPSSWWQSVNAVLIVLLAPLFALLWVRLGKNDLSYPAKFAIGLFFAGLGFAVLVVGSSGLVAGDRISPLWLFAVYLLHTIGELCLSPVGLSSMTKLAPARVVGLMMGVWFLAASVGNFLAGMAAGLEHLPDQQKFGIGAIAGGVMALIMFLLVKPIRAMLKRSEEETSSAA